MTVREHNNLTTNVTLLDKNPPRTMEVFSNERQCCLVIMKASREAQTEMDPVVTFS